MQWSKAKHRVEALFAPSVAGRVELRVTGYRGAHDAEGRGWITIDGEEAWSFCTLRYYVERNELEDELRAANQAADFRDPAQRDAYFAAGDQAEAILERRGVVSRYYFQAAVEAYPELTIERALESANLVHRAFAVLDRRLGRRRLSGLVFRTDEHELVRALYRFRCSSDGITARGYGAVGLPGAS